MENKRNYYRILHVQPDAPEEVIKASYRTLMQKLRQHPDLGGEHWNASIINEAYRVLTNKQSRAAYDKSLFDEASLGKLGKQHQTQRKQPDSPDDDTFKPFKPKAV